MAREQHHQRHVGGTLHSAVGKAEVDLELVCGRMAGDKANSDWCSPTFLCLRLVPNGRTSTYLQHSLWHHGSLRVYWGTHMGMLPASAAVLSLFTICIFHPIVTVSIQHLGTLIPHHTQHLFTVV